jgi:dienelactone hydrolase
MGGSRSEQGTYLQGTCDRSRRKSRLFCKDWGTGDPVVFLATRGQSSDMWQYQMIRMIQQGLVLGNPKSMEELMKWVNSLDRDRKVSDSGAFIEFLSLRPDVKGKRFGATGYCMGGNASVTAAGAFPDRFAGIASFRGGNLGTDKPDSPHLFVKNITGRV